MEIYTKKCYNWCVSFMFLAYILFCLYNTFFRTDRIKVCDRGGRPSQPKTILHKERII